MATIYIDNKPYEVDGKKNLLAAILSVGLDLPYFCWHPAMGSVGACRQCAIKLFKDENDAKGKIVMACLTEVTDGARIALDDPEARHFRKTIIEWLMTNHPHDCPVCDEGGECHLQDMTVMTGHDYRRFRFPKRTYNNQCLGPFINHEMNRCIQCYRCVRFYRDYAGGRDFDAFGVHNIVYFGRHEDGVLENEFSGNLVEICPTGVFTDKSLKQHYTRKWDLQTAPSICVHCGLGCNTIPGERYGELRRIRNRFNAEVNGYFLCDRGRYGYEFVNGDRRLRSAFVRGGSPDSFSSPTWERVQGKDAALKEIAAALNHAQTRHCEESSTKQSPPLAKGTSVSQDQGIASSRTPRNDGREVIGIGSPRASLEANFALRALVGDDNFYRGVSDHEDRQTGLILDKMKNGPVPTASLHDIQSADAMLILGEDVTNTAPIMALAIRQWLRLRPTDIEAHLKIPSWNDSGVGMLIAQSPNPLHMATVYPTKLDDAASFNVCAAPEDLAVLGHAVARAINAPETVETAPPHLKQAVAAIADLLRSAKHPVIVSGMCCGSDTVISAAAAIAETLLGRGASARAIYVTPECNSIGLQLLGGRTLDSAMNAVEKGRVDTVVVLENDLYRRIGKDRADTLFAKCRNVIVLDHISTPTMCNATIGLPCGAFAESDGTYVNLEGRAQRSYQVFVPKDDIQESWRWLRDIMAATGRGDGAEWRNLDDVIAAMTQAVPVLAPVATIAPPASYRIDGMKVARQPHRYSGRTAMNANVNVSEPKPPEDVDAPMTFSMEGYQEQPPAALLSSFWTPGWNSIQSLNKFQEEVGGPLRGGDAGVRLFQVGLGTEKAQAHHDGRNEKNGKNGNRSAEFLFVPVHHIFGSEELSALSPPVAELAPKPYVMLNAEDAAALGLSAGDAANLSLPDAECRAPVCIEPNLPRGLAGLPVGLTAAPVVALPAWGNITRGVEP